MPNSQKPNCAQFGFWSWTRVVIFPPEICMPKCQNPHFWAICLHQHTDRRTDGQTDTIHTSFSLTQPISREHNSPSGKNGNSIKWKFRWLQNVETQNGKPASFFSLDATIHNWKFEISNLKSEKCSMRVLGFLCLSILPAFCLEEALYPLYNFLKFHWISSSRFSLKLFFASKNSILKQK